MYVIYAFIWLYLIIQKDDKQSTKNLAENCEWKWNTEERSERIELDRKSQ